MKKKLYLLIVNILTLIFITGCHHQIPKDALKLTPETLSQRQMQTRKYQTQDEAKILSACAALIQDLGFNLDESETKLGVITASKKRSAVSAGQQTLAVLAALFTGTYVPTDKEQKMRISIITRPMQRNGYISVRVTFQRVVWNTEGQITTLESLTDPKIYKDFFDKLSKAIFLEAQKI